MHGSQGPLNASDGSITAAWRSRFWPGSAGPELFGVCVMSPLPRHSHRAFLSLGSACAWLRGGLLACSPFLPGVCGSFPTVCQASAAGEKPIFFSPVRVTCCFWLEAFQILSLTLELRSSTSVCLGVCVVHQSYLELGEAFPSTQTGFSFGKCSFLLSNYCLICFSTSCYLPLVSPGSVLEVA